MKLLLETLLVLISFASVLATPAFISSSKTLRTTSSIMMSANNNNEGAAPAQHPFCNLPGDPSLYLVTNVDLGDKKLEIMKGISKAIASATGKPESYVAVSIADNTACIFGGTDEPCGLGYVNSIGAIAMESNGKITSDVTDLLEPFGIKENRIYIQFFDMPRANVGWSRRTFAG